MDSTLSLYCVSCSISKFSANTDTRVERCSFRNSLVPQNILPLLGRIETFWFHCNSLFPLLHACMCTHVADISFCKKMEVVQDKYFIHLFHSSIFLFCFFASIYLYVHYKLWRVRMKQKTLLLLPVCTKNYISFSGATKIARIDPFNELWYREDNSQNRALQDSNGVRYLPEEKQLNVQTEKLVKRK